MRPFYFSLFLTLFSILHLTAQHTFSIVAIDPETGEIGSAGATCLDNGASIISGIVPGIGALNAQSLVCTPENINLINGLRWMEQGVDAAGILDSLFVNDQCGADDNQFRQYGAVTIDADGTITADAFTGDKADSYANHNIGPNYAIQGNILLGQEILDSMEARFLNTDGNLAEKLMAAMQGANVVGADTRCAPNGTSSAGAFLRIACPVDVLDCSNIYLDAFQLENGVEPIDTLQSLFDIYFSTPPDTTPENDDCTAAIPIELAANASACALTEVNLRGARESFVPITLCDKNNVTSDIWFSFTTNDELPERGIVIQSEFDNASNPADVMGAGFALYENCQADTYFVGCRSSEDNIDTLLISSKCLSPNTTYYLRVWSQNNKLYEDGTLRFCVYENSEPEFPRVAWGTTEGEGDFSGGLNDWMTIGITDETHIWRWGEQGVLSSLISAYVRSETVCNGAAGFDNVTYQTNGGFLDQFPPGPPYPKMSGELISPSINLSNVQNPVLRFTQAFAGLNGNSNSGTNNPTTLRGAMYSYSIDGGNAWTIPLPVNDDFTANEFSSEVGIKEIALLGIAEQEDVKLKFIWDGDFYYWAIDDVKITGDILSSTVTPSPITIDAQLLGNPVTNQAEVLFTTSNEKEIQFNLFNALGQPILQIQNSIQNGSIQRFDLAHQAKGIYYLHMTDEVGNKRTLKIIKI